MVKNHSQSERGNPLPPHGLLFPIGCKGSFITITPHTTAFVKPIVLHCLEQEIVNGFSMKDRSHDPSHHER